jgi:hypothetical protein
MNKYLRSILYGVIAWLIPFIVAVFFYSRDGKLTVDVFLFKSVMIVLGCFSASFLIVSYFKGISEAYVREGITIGVVWLSISLLLDFLILIPMSGISVTEYFMQIGLRYLVIPVMTIMVGVALSNKS